MIHQDESEASWLGWQAEEELIIEKATGGEVLPKTSLDEIVKK